MNFSRFATIAAICGAATLSSAVSAASYGVFGDNSAAAAAVATAQGNTATVLGDLSAGSIAGYDVVWVLNGNNSGQPGDFGTNAAAIASYVSGGGVLLYHDRNVTDAASSLPGGGGISFTRSLSSDIDVETAGTFVTNGPGGVITNTSLDGGNFSNHGFATLGTLPGGAVGILNNGTAGNIVDFYYGSGSGFVYYSTIPLDFYLGGGSAFANVYAPNVVAFATSLAGGVPEPATWALMLSGFAMTGFALRRRTAVVTA